MNNTIISLTNFTANTISETIDVEQAIRESFGTNIFWLSFLLMFILILYFVFPKKYLTNNYPLTKWAHEMMPLLLVLISWILVYFIMISVYGTGSTTYNLFLYSWTLIVISVVVIKLWKKRKINGKELKAK